MAYIYIIKNIINNKVYIGKTVFSIERRFKEHIRDSKKKRTEHRPLYNAMNKYGVEKFFIELLEECPSDIANEREIYWITQYNSYKSGYNATLGGDGKTFLDYRKILNLFDCTNLSQKEIAEECKCSVDSVRRIILEYRENVNWQLRFKENHPEYCFKTAFPKVRVKCIEEDKIFPSSLEAACWLIEQGKTKTKESRSHITQVCKGKRKRAYGYTWKYV